MKKPLTLVIAVFGLSASAVMAGSSSLPAYATFRSYADVNGAALEGRLPGLDNNREVLVSAAGSVTSCSFATKFTFEDNDGNPVSVDSCRIVYVDFGIISTVNGVTTHHVNHVDMSLSKFNPEGDGSRPNIYMTDATGATLSPAGSACTTNVVGQVRHICITDQTIGLGSPTPFPKLARVGDHYDLYRNIEFEYTKGGQTYRSSMLDTSASVQIVGIIPAFPQSTSPTVGSIPVIEKVETVSQGEGTGIKLTISGLDESWPYSVTLESATDLQNWSEVVGIGGGKNPDGTWYLTVPMSGPRRQFRLSHPKRWNWLIGD